MITSPVIALSEIRDSIWARAGPMRIGGTAFSRRDTLTARSRAVAVGPDTYVAEVATPKSSVAAAVVITFAAGWTTAFVSTIEYFDTSRSC